MKRIHLIGIGGSGMSAIARLLKERGYVVSGSDHSLTPLASQLHSEGIQVVIGHLAQNVAGADLVVRSSAIPDDNPEVAAALEAGIPVLKRADFLGELMLEKKGIAVAGTHGKTTTTAMIAWTLTFLGQDPSYIIGGVAKNLSGNAHAGRGSAFVIEADEYDRMFLGLRPSMAIVTNMEHDHPDCFPTPLDYHEAFAAFVGGLRPGGCLLVCADDPEAVGLMNTLPPHTYALTYGLNPAANYRADHLEPNTTGGFSFQTSFQTNDGAVLNLGDASLLVPGEHNVRNAIAALAVAHQLGLSMLAATEAISRFSGTERRFDILGDGNGVTVVNDYAHHPTEIRATLAAARSRYPGRQIWAVWQPHTYSRTRGLQAEFASSFTEADRVIVTGIYAAREPREDFSPAVIVEQMAHPGAIYIQELPEVSRYLIDHTAPGDVVIVLSAGDADQVSTNVLAYLQRRET